MKKIPIWKNVVLILSVVVVIVIATLAWFYRGPRATADDVVVHVGKATYVQISGDSGGNWSEDLDVEIGVNRNFKEISGNGSSFFAPEYDVVQNASGGYSTQLVSFHRVNENQYYYEQILDLRGDTIQDVYLAPESCVSSVDPEGNSYIDGAIRIAFYELDENGKETLRCIWAPNSTVEYSPETNSFTRDGSVEPYYYYQKTVTPADPSGLDETNPDVAIISTDGTDELGCGYNQAYQYMWSNGENLPANAPRLLTLNATGNDKHFYKQMKIKVWLEGYDRECVSLLSGQKFTIKLQFVAREVE